jgi:caa(3)-type oxidase subunit IV
LSEHAHAAPHAPHAAHRNYVAIWAVLTVLLVLSVLGSIVGAKLSLPVITLTAAFGIALVKAYLVAKNFMHLDVEKPIVHWALGAVLILMVLMYAGLAPDVQKSTGKNWVKTPGFHYMSVQARGEFEPHPAAKPGAPGEAGAAH